MTRDSVAGVARILTLVALAACLLPAAACGDSNGGGVTVSSGLTTTTAAPSTTSSAPVSTSALGVTTTAGATETTQATIHGLTIGTTEGPYYVSGTAELTDQDLNYTGLPGEQIKITGHVYSGTDTSSPIAGAKIEIWQADTDGVYHPEGNGDIGQYGANELALRGYVLSDTAGAYQFASIYPGYYQGRARHIHVRVSAEGYGAVTTQIIVPAKPGDGTTPENDMIAQSLPQANFVTFSDQSGVQTGTFDFFIAPD